MKLSDMTPADRRARFNSERKLTDSAVRAARAYYDSVPGSRRKSHLGVSELESMR